MKKFLQYFWLFLFAFFVFGLGIFAYKLSSDTLVFAFENSENQTGNSMVLAFDKPWTLSRMIPSGALIDIDAIKKSLLYNGNPISEQELENFDFKTTESYIEIIPKNPQNGDILTLSAFLYSDNKKTSYQLPSDISLQISENNEKIEISNSGIPSEINTFSVNFPENISSKNILWYVYYPKNNESCYSDNIFWDAYRFSRVDVTLDENNENIFHLDIDSKKNICLIAGLSNQIIPVLDRKLNDFSYTADISQVLDTEENIQDEIIFSFSSPILPDFDADSEIYKKLKTEKISEILKHISISPNIDFSEKNIDINANSLRIIADFQNNQKYNLHISTISDIYGREISPKFTFTPDNSPFLSLNTDKNQQKFQNFSDISAKIFAISPEKNEYEIKLCRLDAYGFSRLNQIYSEKNKQNLEEVYNILTSSHSAECQKKPLQINQNSSFTSFRPIEIFDAQNLRPGFYVLAFQNIEDVKKFENFVAPFPFSVANSEIQAIINSHSESLFLVTDSLWNAVMNQEIEILKKIPWENWNFSYATGSIIGKTNDKGFLWKNLQEFSDSEILVITRWDKKFWFFSQKIPALNSSDSHFSTEFLTNGEIFHKNDILNVSIILKEKENFLKNQKFLVELFSENNDSIKKSTLISNDFWVIAFDFEFKDSLLYGNYFLKIFREKSDGNLENIWEKKIIFSEKEWEKYSVNAEIRFLNTENSVPRSLLEKPNTNDKFPYYKNIYSASVQSEIIARAYDENGQILKNSPFQYKIFRKKISQIDEKRELIKEWISNFDSDGLGLVAENINFETFYHDIEYSVEINVQNPKTGDFSQGFAHTFLKVPAEFHTFDDSFLVDFSLPKEIFTKNETISFYFSNEIWSQFNNKKYRFDLLNSSNDTLYSADIVNQKTEIPKLPLHSGIYQIKLYPITPEGIIPPENTIISKNFLIKSEEDFSVQNAEIFSNISEKNIENIITSPTVSGKILVAYSYDDEIFTDYFSFSGNIIPYNFLRENISGNIHFSSMIQSADGQKFFSEKFIQIPEKNEKININFSKNNSEKNNFSAQISLVDEQNNAISWNTIIRIFEWNPGSKNFENIFKRENNSRLGFMGNIFQKNFEIFSEKKKVENFENSQTNLYFSPSISSDKNGQIKLDIENFSPKKEYYIEVFAYTPTGKKWYFIQKFENKKDFDFSVQIPEFLYVGDRPSIRFSAKNNTQTIVQAIPKIEFTHKDEALILTGSLFLNLGKNEELLLPVRFPDHWQGSVHYEASLEQNNEIISRLAGDIFLEAIPTMWLSESQILSGTGKLDVKNFSDSLYNKEKSKIQIFASESLAAFIPKYFNDIYFTLKTTKTDILSGFYIRAKLTWNKDFSYLVDKNSLQNEMNDFFQKNLKIFQENKNFSKNLENMEKVARLVNTGFFSQNNIIFEMKKYISHAIETEFENLKNDENIKIFLIQTLLNEKIDEKKFSKIQLDSISQNAFLDYLEILTLKKKEISHEIFDLYFARFNANFEAEILPNSFRKQNAKIAKILLENNKNEKFTEILPKFLGTSNAIFSVSEMVELIDLALIHNQKISSNPAKIALQSGIITASDDLNSEKKIISWNLESSKLSDIISLSTSGKWEIFYAIFEENILEAPALFPSRNSDFLETTTTIEKVYEMAWFDENWNYRASEKISDNNLEKNTLYKATTLVKVKNMKDKKWKNLALKIFTFPGSEIFYQNKKTEKIIFEKNFNLQKIKPYNYFLQAEKEGSAGDTEFSYSYFFRPKIEGSYLLPGNFVYFIDGKEFFANSSHNYFHIQ